MGWFHKREEAGVPLEPWQIAGAACEGLFALRGNQNEILARLLTAKQGVDSADARGTDSDRMRSVAAYNEVLEELLPCLDACDLPLSNEYAIDDSRISADYRDLRERAATQDAFTLDALLRLPRCANIAIVRVVRGRTATDERVTVDVQEVFRGQWANRQRIVSPTMPRIGIHWFRADETVLTFCSSDNVSIGEVGRMPLWQSGPARYVCSFTRPAFWSPTEATFDHGCSFVLLESVRKRLREHT